MVKSVLHKPRYKLHTIQYGGELVGYKVYQYGGIFNTLVFKRYLWL